MMRPWHVLPLVLTPMAAMAACAGDETDGAGGVDASTQIQEEASTGFAEGGVDASVDALFDGEVVGDHRWVKMSIPITKGSLFDVWGSSSKDVWAVGSSGIILHFDGQSWTSVPSGTTQSLNAVWGSGTNNVWVGSSTQLMLHGGGMGVDGGAFAVTPIYTQEQNSMIATIYDLDGTGPNDVWAVGDYTILWGDPQLGAITIGAWHWDGDGWNRVPVVNDFSRPGADARVALRSVWAANAGDVWLGGNFGRTYRNPAWSPSAPISRGGAVGMQPLAPWVEYDSASRADIERTWGTWSDDVWAVGRNGVLRHWDGTSSFLWSTIDLGTTEDLHGVWGRSKDDVWAVGDNSAIAHWDGKQWTRELADPGLRLYGVWGDANDVFIVGEGVILRRTSMGGGAQ